MKDYRQPTNTRKLIKLCALMLNKKYPLCSSGTNNRYIMRTTIKQCRCIYLLLTNNDYMDKFHEWMNILKYPLNNFFVIYIYIIYIWIYIM